MLASTKGRYGLRMMIDIARHSDGGRVSLRTIGERQGISIKYLEQLAHLLCSAGLLHGCRGQGGGYILAAPAETITAGDILRATEGSVAPVMCLCSDEVCPRSAACETVHFWCGLNETINAYINSVTLADLVHGCEHNPVIPGPCLGSGHRGE